MHFHSINHHHHFSSSFQISLSLSIEKIFQKALKYISNLKNMAQNFDPFHVPQQNRRNKLRVNPFQTQTQNHQTTQQNLMMMNNNNNNNNNLCDPLQQGLSLSLSFQLLDDHHHHHIDQMRSSSYNYNAVSSVLDDLLKHNNTNNHNNGVIISSVPLGPFTGYASILKNSRFLKPAQQVLDDLCGSSLNCGFSTDFSTDFLTENAVMRESFGFTDRVKLQFNDSKLMFLLDEVYKKYKVYCEQMQSVVASFETVAGLGNAAPYICYAIKTVSKHFMCLKNALLNQIHHFPGGAAAAANHHEQLIKCNENQISFLQHPVWRSQRGLPDHAVAVLKSWLFEHFLHPYPTDSEKQILAQHTGLSRTQVSNWFINARVRLWKPMVEEVYKLSSQQPQLENNNNNINPTSDHNLYRQHCIKTKRSRHELNTNPSDEHHRHMSGQIRQEDQDTNLVSNLDNLTSHYQAAISGRNNVVNLALGLHQNNNNNYGPIHDIAQQHVNNLHLLGLMDSASAAASFQAQAHNLGN